MTNSTLISEATAEQLEMARRIALEAWPHDITITEPLRLYMENAALAAIIETQRLDADLAWKMAGKQMPAYAVGEAIRAGKHYGKDEG